MKTLLAIFIIVIVLVIIWLDGINVRDSLDTYLFSSNLQNGKVVEKINNSKFLFRFEHVNIEQWVLIITTSMGIFGTYYLTKKNIENQLKEERKLRQISEIEKKLNSVYEKRINRKKKELREINDAMTNLKNTSLYSEIQAIDGYNSNNSIGINAISIPLSNEEPNSNLKFIAAIKEIENKLNLTSSVANKVLISTRLIEKDYIICEVDLSIAFGEKVSLLIFNHGYQRELHEFLQRNSAKISEETFCKVRDSFYELSDAVTTIHKKGETTKEDLKLLKCNVANFLKNRGDMYSMLGENHHYYDEIEILSKFLKEEIKVVILQNEPLLREDYIVHVFSDTLYKENIELFEMRINSLENKINRLKIKKNSI